MRSEGRSNKTGMRKLYYRIRMQVAVTDKDFASWHRAKMKLLALAVMLLLLAAMPLLAQNPGDANLTTASLDSACISTSCCLTVPLSVTHRRRSLLALLW